MDKNILLSQWDDIREKIQEKWSKLTDQDLEAIRGRRDELLRRLEERYGIATERAEQQINELERACTACGQKEESRRQESRPQNKASQEERRPSRPTQPQKQQTSKQQNKR